MASPPICEPVDLPLGRSIIVERVQTAADAPPSDRLPHFHDVAELVFFAKVEGVFITESERYALTDGSVIFVPSMRQHDFELGGGQKIWTLIQVDPFAINQLALRSSLTQLSRPFAATLSGPLRSRIVALADWLVEEATKPTHEGLVDRLVELLLIAVTKAPAIEAMKCTSDPTQFERLLPALDVVRQKPGSGLTLKEAATKCRMSPAYFSARFKAVLGMTFSDYLRTYRLHLATRRLISTGAPVSTIAYDLGFVSPSHFTARFRDRFGMTPREYRAAARSSVGQTD